MQQSQDAIDLEKLIKWISPKDFRAQHSDIISRKQEGTGQWFLETAAFKSWLQRAGETLYCPGIPGAGKTVMAANAVDYLIRTGDHGVAVVYCSYKASAEETAATLLGAILRQLVDARPSTGKYVEPLRTQNDKPGTRPKLEEFAKTIQSVIEDYSNVYIVVDALDECPVASRHQFLETLQTLQKAVGLHLMVTSRPLPELGSKFNGLTIEICARNEDVTQFIKGRTCQLPKCIQRNVELQKSVHDTIAKETGGM